MSEQDLFPGMDLWTGIKKRAIYRGDCLDVLKNIPSNSIDLVYLDPPFNSKSTYNLPFKSMGKTHKEVKVFEDTWKWQDTPHESGLTDNERLETLRSDPKLRDIAFLVDFARKQDTPNNSMGSYILSMAYRLQAIHRVLRDTGSVYLHCNHSANYFLRIIMDCIFGRENNRNEIIWCYSRPSAPNQRQLSRVHQTILWYSKGNKWTFNPDDIRQPYAKSSKNREGYAANASKIAEGTVQLDERGKFPESWIYISELKKNSEESLGYPTQKPLALIRRIIKASSNRGDLVLDPFCGCGTTVHAAEELERQWIGIDISRFSVSLIKERILSNFGGVLSPTDIEISGQPETIQDARRLAKQDPFEFEKWVCGKIGANGVAARRGPDGGIDGIIELIAIENGKAENKTAIVQVKGGNVTADSVRALDTVVRRSGSVSGIMVCFEDQIRTVENQKGTDYWSDDSGSYPAIQGITIERLIDGDRPYLPSSYGRRRGGRISA